MYLKKYIKYFIKKINKTYYNRLFSKEDNLFLNWGGIKVIDTCDPIFITGTGRSGTHFLAELMKRNKKLNAFHQDDINQSVGDSFERYTRWYNLKIDHSNFIMSRALLINTSKRNGLGYAESNAMLALSIGALYSNFKGKYIITIRNPKNVVESHFNKGWYSENYNINYEYPPGYEYFHKRSNHYFSRIYPKTKYGKKNWKNIPRLGKIAWMWSSQYLHIIRQLNDIPSINWKIIYIDEFSYNNYTELIEWLQLDSCISKTEFDKLIREKPGKGNYNNIIKWDKESIKYYNKEIKVIIDKLYKDVPTDNWILDENILHS